MIEKLDGMTKDLVKENIEKLKELFPTIVKEDKIDFEELQLILGEDINKNKEQYSFVWNGKTEATKLAQKRSTGTLRPCIEESKNWDTTKNIYIEGDNLEVLKLLQSSYNGRIKMIYIDPPYNTGKDLVYKDSFQDNISNYKQVTSQGAKSNAETDGRFHTNWLNMMYPRLKLARNLLKSDGIIFISIDDKEARNCKILCDEIFGENNFIAQIVVEGTPKNDPLIISTAHEYCLVYVKNYEEAKECEWGVKNPIYEQLEQIYNNNKPNYKNIENKLREFYIENNLNSDNISNYKYADEKGIYRIGPIDDPQRGGPKDTRYNPKTGEALKTPNSGWRCNLETWNLWIKENLVNFPEDNNNLCSKKTYISSSKLDLLRAYFKVQTRKDTDMLENYFGAKVFQFPKPVNLIKSFIECANDKNGIYLDFFSGSATTAHATMMLNAEDGGNRRFILVQLPENLVENLNTAQGNREKQTLKNAIEWCENNNKPCFITEIAEERICIAGQKIQEELKVYARERKIEGKRLLSSGTAGDLDHVEYKDIETGEITSESRFIHEPKDIYKYNPEKLDIGFKVFKLDSSNLKKWNNIPTKDADEVAKRIQISLDYLENDRTELDLVYEVMLKYGIDLTLPITKTANEKAYIVEAQEYKLLICSQMYLKLEDIEEFANESVGTYLFADRCFSDDNLLINAQEILKAKNKEMRLF